MLPPPTLLFTIPSIHNDTLIDCRVYHPLRLNPSTISQAAEPWLKKAAIVAHPYAPLGGNYDDPVVHLVASIILKQGFMVGTFNFRGAGSSKGVTSWSSKPEQADYISMIGFMVYYMHHLVVPALHTTNLDRQDFMQHEDEGFHTLEHSLSSEPKMNSHPHVTLPQRREDSKPTMLLAGYSYGGLVTSCLPPLSEQSILLPFIAPETGTAAAEIRLRAANLATVQNELLHIRFQAQLSQPTTVSPHRHGRNVVKIDDYTSSTGNNSLRMGGGENLQRSSHESLRSIRSFQAEEVMRKSVDRVRTIARVTRFPTRRASSTGSRSSIQAERLEKLRSRSTPEASPAPEPEQLAIIPGVDRLNTAYLLISPPKGILRSLVTMWTARPRYASGKEKECITEDDVKLIANPTLMLYTDNDAVISVKKLRAWANRLAHAENAHESSRFRCVEVHGGGHLWHDHDALRVLMHEVKEFVGSL